MSDGAGKYERLMKAAIENVSQSFFDEYERSNAEFRAKAGLKMLVIREEVGDCCDWCADLAGVYDYEDAPSEVWQRHAHCRCMVVTRTEKGTYQDAWSRKEYQSQREARIAREEEIIADRENETITPAFGTDVTIDYLKNALPDSGKVLYAQGFRDVDGEEACGKWLNHIFGGSVTLLGKSEQENVLSPDFYWKEKLWDLKTPRSKEKKTIKKRIYHGIDQINTNPGGLILDYSHAGLSWKNSIQVTEQIFVNKNIKGIDVIIKKKERFMVIRT